MKFNERAQLDICAKGQWQGTHLSIEGLKVRSPTSEGTAAALLGSFNPNKEAHSDFDLGPHLTKKQNQTKDINQTKR